MPLWGKGEGIIVNLLTKVCDLNEWRSHFPMNFKHSFRSGTTKNSDPRVQHVKIKLTIERTNSSPLSPVSPILITLHPNSSVPYHLSLIAFYLPPNPNSPAPILWSLSSFQYKPAINTPSYNPFLYLLIPKPSIPIPVPQSLSPSPHPYPNNSLFIPHLLYSSVILYQVFL